MSTSKLPASIAQLVESSFPEGQRGDSNPVVNEWIDKISGEQVLLPELDKTLSTKTYLVGTEPTAADIALYGALHPVLSALKPEQHYTHPSVTRYFDLIQNLPTVRNSPNAPPLVTIDLENAPKVERKADVKKEKKPKKEGAAATPAEASGSQTPAAADTSSATKATGESQTNKKEKKAKKEPAAAADAAGGKKGGKTAAAPAASSSADSGEPSPAMIELRVGHIVDVKKHPDADGLYVEQIDLGEETGPRTIVSGLVNYVPIEQMQDKWLVVVANLKPASMRGIKSYGMVLCATSKDGKEGGIEIIDPPKGCKPGDRVFFEGEKYENVEPVQQLNPKKKIWETIQPGFITLDSKEAAWIDPQTKSAHRLMTKIGPCSAPTLIGATLS
ncbi:G4 quadruplex nucleic acid binding protein [Tulasnella sp. 418]|nr:G4 quadruplex nucleic acid binding protein [Tulasnella sp. 418]